MASAFSVPFSALDRSILITGASSGIGAALARHYAAPGVTLGLVGRDAERLHAVAARCGELGAIAHLIIIDVGDAEAMRAALLAFDDQHPVGLLIANAGVSVGVSEAGEDESEWQSLMRVNVGGVLNTALPLVPRMQARGQGQIGLVSSLAGVRGLPSCPAYSASKVFVRALGDAWRGALKPHNIVVSVILPGYVRTPMTAKNIFPMPFLMDAEQAAAKIARGLARGSARIAFPRLLYWPLCWLAALPAAFTEGFFTRLPKKTPETPCLAPNTPCLDSNTPV